MRALGDQLVLAALGEYLVSRGLGRLALADHGLAGLSWGGRLPGGPVHRDDCVLAPSTPLRLAHRADRGLHLAEIESARRCGECDRDLPITSPRSHSLLHRLALSLDFVLRGFLLLPRLVEDATSTAPRGACAYDLACWVQMLTSDLGVIDELSPRLPHELARLLPPVLAPALAPARTELARARSRLEGLTRTGETLRALRELTGDHEASTTPRLLLQRFTSAEDAEESAPRTLAILELLLPSTGRLLASASGFVCSEVPDVWVQPRTGGRALEYCVLEHVELTRFPALAEVAAALPHLPVRDAWEVAVNALAPS